MSQLARNGREAVPPPVGIVLASEQTAGCGEIARQSLEQAGWKAHLYAVETEYEQAFRSLKDSPVAGVITVSLAGLADSLLKGSTPGADWLEAVAASGAPSVVVTGDLDSVRFASAEDIPIHLRRRKQHTLESGRALIRTDVTENARLGRLIAEQVNASRGPVALCMPLRGLSSLDTTDGPFYSMDARMALFGNMTTHLRRDIPLYEGNVNINDTAFAQLCAEALMHVKAG